MTKWVIRLSIDAKLRQDLQNFIDSNFIEDPEEQFSIIDNLKGKLFRKIFDVDDIAQQAQGSSFDDKYMTNLHKVLEKKGPTFSETLFSFIDKRGLKDSAVYNKARISRQLFSKIRIHTNYKPTKATVFMFALALELDIEDTKKLLASAGLAFSHSVKQDLIIKFLIENGFHDVDFVNEVLYEFGAPTLGV